ncbi:MAG: histidine phosphatase family protein, partial [Ghiorsea sp.]
LVASGVDFRHDIRPLNPSNGESFQQFSTRVQTAWQQYVKQHSNLDEHHLLITHGGVMRVILGMLLHIPMQHLGKLYIPHASWSRVSLLEGEPPVLWFMNRHG